MTDQSRTPAPADTIKSEKLRAIAAVFGEAVAARLGHAGEAPAPARPVAEDRLAWQTNRLIRHLRTRVRDAPSLAGAATGPAQGAAADPQAAAPHPTATAPARTDRSRRIPALAAGEDLSREHPAVIAHMLRAETKPVQVAVLRALPGQLSREVMRRLKTA